MTWRAFFDLDLVFAVFFLTELPFLEGELFETVVLDFEPVLDAGSAPIGELTARKSMAAMAAAEVPKRLFTDGIIRTDPLPVNPKSSWGSIVYAGSA
jgi:hypothetical protein